MTPPFVIKEWVTPLKGEEVVLYYFKWVLTESFKQQKMEISYRFFLCWVLLYRVNWFNNKGFWDLSYKLVIHLASSPVDVWTKFNLMSFLAYTITDLTFSKLKYFFRRTKNRSFYSLKKIATSQILEFFDLKRLNFNFHRVTTKMDILLLSHG